MALRAAERSVRAGSIKADADSVVTACESALPAEAPVVVGTLEGSLSRRKSSGDDESDGASTSVAVSLYIRRRFAAACAFLIKVCVTTAVCVAALAPRYHRGDETKGTRLGSRQAGLAAARCCLGAVVGRILAAAIQTTTSCDLVVRAVPLVILVMDALEVWPLEVLTQSCGLYLAPWLGRVVFRSPGVLGGTLLHRAVRQRLLRILTTTMVLGSTNAVQRIIVLWTLRRWTAEKFAERVSTALDCRQIVRALADVARREYLQLQHAAKLDTARKRSAAQTILGVLRKNAAASSSRASQPRDETDTKSPPMTETAGLDSDTLVGSDASLPHLSFGSDDVSFVGSRGFESSARKLRVALELSDFGTLDSSDRGLRIGKRIFRLVRGAAARRTGQPPGALLQRDDLSALVFERLAGATDNTEAKAALARMAAAFDELFPPATTSLGEADVVEPVLRVFRERSFLSATIHSFGAINQMLVRIAEVTWLVFAMTFVLIFWRVDLTDVVLVLGALSLGLSIAFGSYVATLCSGVSYIIFTAPYDIGDRVIVADIARSPDGLFPMYVTSIGAFTTTFSTSFGETVVIANHILATKQVMNHGRSPDPCLRCTVRLAATTTPNDVDGFLAAVDEFQSVHASDWKSLDVFVTAFDSDAGALQIDVWASGRYSYQDFIQLYQARTRLYRFVHAYIHAAGIHFAKPLQPVVIRDGLIS